MSFYRQLMTRQGRYILEFEAEIRKSDKRAFRRGEHNKFIAEYKGHMVAEAHPKRIAIVALFPSEALTFSILNLFRALRSEGFFIVAISPARISEEQRNKFLQLCDYYFERHTVGRDFGSYRLGWRWLNERGLLAETETLAFINDSIFYPHSFADQLRQLVDLPSDWRGLFEFFVRRHHVSSFFQVFSRKVFCSEAFQRFWKDYVPRSSRIHAIDKGELALSAAMFGGGFKPSILYSAKRICSDALAALTANARDPELLFAIRLATTLWPAKDASAPALEWREVFEQTAPYEIAHQLAYNIENNNPTHVAGLLCNMLYGAPLKRDLVYRQIFPLTTLISTCRHFTEEEKKAMEDDLRAKGLPVSVRASGRLRTLYQKGHI